MPITPRRAGLVLLAGVVALAAIAGVLFVTNAAPSVPRLPDADVESATSPYIVKLHAQWCPLCMMTRGVWSNIEQTYADRVRLVVFDFTNDATTRASEVEARRLGLGGLFDDYNGVTGTILVLNGRSREVLDDLHGNTNFADYRRAIDAALRPAAR